MSALERCLSSRSKVTGGGPPFKNLFSKCSKKDCEAMKRCRVPKKASYFIIEPPSSFYTLWQTFEILILNLHLAAFAHQCICAPVYLRSDGYALHCIYAPEHIRSNLLALMHLCSIVFAYQCIYSPLNLCSTAFALHLSGLSSICAPINMC